jgi:uncharacterized protein (TIGR02145 family)
MKIKRYNNIARVDYLILIIKNAILILVRNFNLKVNNKIFTMLPSAGNRNSNNGSMNNQGSWGNIWSSSVNGSNSFNLNFNSDNANKNNNNRANGQSVRCLKD